MDGCMYVDGFMYACIFMFGCMNNEFCFAHDVYGTLRSRILKVIVNDESSFPDIDQSNTDGIGACGMCR